MRMPAAGDDAAPERGGAEHGATRPASGSIAVPSLAHDVVASPGEPLDDATRAFMEPRFGRDFSDVRVHVDDAAARSAHAAGALAYTVGEHVAFASSRYAPASATGRRLLAHELAHVAQAPRGQPMLRSPDRRARAAFDLYASEIGARIGAGLVSDEVTLPASRPDARRTPLVDPDAVLEILAASALFNEDAAAVERLYFTDRERAPELTFRFHVRPELGTEFARAGSRITVEVTTLTEVIKGIVHEVVHARHRTPSIAPATARVGEVTRVEEAGVEEEARTRLRERQVMADIAAQEPWRARTGGAAVKPVPRRAEELTGEVRDSFRSGWPMLTYPEGFIIEEMKRQAGAGIDAARAATALAEMRRLAYFLALPPAPVRPENLDAFRVDDATVNRYRETRAAPEPVAPPSLSEALACERIFRGTPEWRREFRRSSRLPADARVSPSCRGFIESAHDYIWQNEPTEESERRAFFISILSQMEVRYREALAAREASGLFLAWYNAVPEANRAQAREFFEWLLIEQTMSREWEALGGAVPDPELRRRHLDFLAARIGRPLRGISRAGL
jgi:hypothetical protein